MSKINCPCGWQMSDVGQPCANVRHFITDGQLDEMFDMGDDLGNAHSVGELICDRSREFWQCHECGRLAFLQTDGTGLKWYTPEYKWRKTDHPHDGHGPLP